MVPSKILNLAAFVPAEDFPLSRRFYRDLGFREKWGDDQACELELGGFSFIMQNFYVKELADNLMAQLLVRDVDSWWRRIDAAKLVDEFAVKPPRAPTMQDWGLKVGFLFDPSGVLWHVAEVPF